jgi:hypothetical protein
MTKKYLSSFRDHGTKFCYKTQKVPCFKIKRPMETSKKVILENRHDDHYSFSRILNGSSFLVCHHLDRRNLYREEETMDGNEQTKCKKRKRKLELIDEAKSNGSYLWSYDDLKNAMLWFVSDQTFAKDDDNFDRCNLQTLIYSLIQSPGIFHQRPLKDLRSGVGLKEEGSLLPKIISQCINHSERSNADGSPENLTKSTKWLQSALCDIAIVRRSNEELFDNYQQKYEKMISYDKNDEKISAEEKRDREYWKYLAHPSTLIKSVYAAQMYEHFLKLSCKNVHCEEDVIHQNNDDLSMDALSFLNKMKRLAKIQPCIVEVYIHMTLEPMKRKQLPGLSLMDILSSEADFDSDITDPVEKESFRLLSESIRETISETNVFKLPPVLMSIVSKLFFPFAKTFIEKLISRALQAHEAIPTSIINHAVSSSSATRDAKLTATFGEITYTPKQDLDLCVNILSFLFQTKHDMKFLSRDICHILYRSYQNDAARKALEEIISRLYC